MSRAIYIGIDGGGGSSECLLADAAGNPVGIGHGGGSNLPSAGLEGVRQSLACAIREAGLEESDRVPCACLGLSGAIPEGENSQLKEMAKKLLPQASRVIITNDAVNALAGAFCLEPGICVNSGTGTFGIGKNAAGKLAFASGWGALVGDEGSGYWIGIHALTAVIKAHDHRGPETTLSRRLLKTLQADSLELAVLAIYGQANPRPVVAGLCPAVLACAAEGDRVALEIVDEAARELALTAYAVAEQLDLLDQPVKVAKAGNVLLQGEFLADKYSQEIIRLLPQAEVTRPRFSPTIGSLLLAYQADEVPISAVVESLSRKNTLLERIK